MSLTSARRAEGITARQAWTGLALLAGAVFLWMVFGIWPDWLNALLDSKKAFVSAVLNGVTLAGLYFLVASGFTLVFGLMRNVNLAHGSLYLLGAYVGYDVNQWTGDWFVGVIAGTLALGVVGALLQVFVFQRLAGDELRQTLVTIGISIVAADLMLAVWGGKTYQFTIPDWLDGSVATPIITAIKSNGQIVTMRYPLYRLVVLAASVVIGLGLWLALNRTKVGMMIRAGVDDRAMLSMTGVNVRLLFVGVFAIGGGLAGFAGVVGGSALSVSPGEDIRYLLASLVVVIVGGMGSITGAAIGALLIGLAEQIGLVYFPTYGIVLTFVIMVVTLAIRPQGLMGNARTRQADPPRVAIPGDIVTPEFTAATAWLGAALILFPLLVSPFVAFQLGAQTLILGMIALSLMVLAGYGGMVSLAQLTIAGVAGYAVAILGPNGTGVLGLGWPWQLYVPVSIGIAGGVSALIGMIAVRTAGIYTIMITLAVATAFFYFAQQNYSLFNGHSGFRGVQPPVVFGVDWRQQIPFYYLTLGVAAVAYSVVIYCARSPFGRALMATRDNQRRMRAVGYDVTHHRIAAYFFAGIIAGTAGVLYVWFNGRISPGTVGVGEVIGILVIAVIGGLRHPIGPFIGAALYVFLKTFAIDVVGADRFNTLIGLVFLVIVFASPDGPVWSLASARAALGHQTLTRISRVGKMFPKARHGRSTEEMMKVTTKSLLLTALMGGAVLAPQMAFAEDTIKVGLLATLEGPFTVLGQDGVRGAELALSEAGYMAGGKKIVIIKGSSDASPDSAVKAARKLVEQDGVAILIGPLSGDEGLAVKDYAKTQPNVTFVNGTSAAQDTTLRDPASNFFRFSTDGAQWMAGLGDYVYNVKKYRTVVTVAEDYSFPYSQVFGFMASFCRDGGHVPKKFWVPIGNKDFSSVIAAIPDTADAIYVALGGADGVNFLTQYQQAGGTAPLIGGSITVDQTVLGTQGKQRDYVVGTPSAGPIADNSDEPAWKKFVADYKAAYKDGFPSPSLFAQGYYINTKAVLLALNDVGGDLSDKEVKFRDTLSKLEFDTPTGKVKLDKNRQAIADNYLTEVAKADDGHLYNKVIKVVHDVNQTMGIPEADFLKLGVAGRDNPDCK